MNNGRNWSQKHIEELIRKQVRTGKDIFIGFVPIQNLDPSKINDMGYAACTDSMPANIGDFKATYRKVSALKYGADYLWASSSFYIEVYKNITEGETIGVIIPPFYNSELDDGIDALRATFGKYNKGRIFKVVTIDSVFGADSGRLCYPGSQTAYIASTFPYPPSTISSDNKIFIPSKDYWRTDNQTTSGRITLVATKDLTPDDSGTYVISETTKEWIKQ